MNTTINISLLGKGNVESLFKGAKGAVRDFVSDTVKGNQNISQSSQQASTAITRIGSTAKGTGNSLKDLGSSGHKVGSDISAGASRGTSALAHMGTIGGHAAGAIHQGALHASHGLSAMGNEGGKAAEEISRSGETASHSLSRTGEAGRNAGRSISQGATTASKSIDNITKSSETARSGLGELGDLLGMVMGGIGAAQIGMMFWEGATERQFNQAYLSMKLGDAQAKEMAHSIEEIVAAVPGDDTFMNTLLGSAAARGAAITDLKTLGYVAADYLVAAKKTGQTQIEAQQDLNAYIMTGTTGELERSRVLAGQVDKLEGKETIHERILALDEALKANGYQGLSQMDIMTIKWETFKGKIQVAATEIGWKILPYLEKGVNYLLELDEKTGGWSTMIGLAAAGVVTLGLALGPVVWSAKEILGSFSGISDKLKGITGGGKKKIDLECNPCPDDSQIGGGSKGKGSTSGKGGTVSRIIDKLGLTEVIAGTGTAAGVTGTLSSLAVGLAGGASIAGGGYGLQSIGNWFGSQPGMQSPGAQAVTGNVANIAGLMAGPFAAPFASMGGSWAGGTNLFAINKDIDWGKAWSDNTKWLEGLWKNPFPSAKAPTGGSGANLGSLLGGLLPGTSHAAGGQGKSSIMDDIFGSKGVLRGTPLAGAKIPDFKWPNPSQVLHQITQGISTKIPKLSWKIPNVSQILGETADKINPLNWKIPGVGQLLGQTWDRINPLNWDIPGVGQLLGQTWQRINPLNWQIPTWDQVLGAITSKIPGFSWPMGPGGVRASSVASDVGSRARALLSSGPAGPINSAIASTMSNRSGIGQGYILDAMGRRFNGVDAFQSIANGMSDHLSYEFYFGGQKSNQAVWDSGTCNCYDGAEFLQAEASQRFGLSSGLTNGLWDGTGIAHTWSTIGGRPFDMAAKLIRGHWNPPAGPGSFDEFMTDIGPGLEYMGYMGHLVDPVGSLDSGGNCFDMTLGAMMVAENLWGLPTKMIWGTYEGNSHVWAEIDGRNYDLARRAREGSYSPPPQLPAGPLSSGSTVKVDVGGIHIQGPINGVDDLERRLEKAEKKAGDTIAARILSQYGG